MKKYVIEEHNNKNWVLSEITDNSKTLIGKFYNKSEAEFHRDIRNQVENENLLKEVKWIK